MAETVNNKAAGTKKDNNLPKGTPGGVDAPSGKKSVPVISTPGRAFEPFANDQAFKNQATVKPPLILGFASAQEYVAFKNAEKEEQETITANVAAAPLGLYEPPKVGLFTIVVDKKALGKSKQSRFQVRRKSDGSVLNPDTAELLEDQKKPTKKKTAKDPDLSKRKRIKIITDQEEDDPLNVILQRKDSQDKAVKLTVKTDSVLNQLIQKPVVVIAASGSDPDAAERREQVVKKPRQKKACFKQEVKDDQRKKYQRDRKRSEAPPKTIAPKPIPLSVKHDQITLAGQKLIKSWELNNAIHRHGQAIHPTIKTLKEHLSAALGEPQHEEVVKHIMAQLKSGVSTWARENRLAASATAEKHCTLCGKYHTGSKSKHPHCLWTALSPTEYYSFLKMDD